MRVKAPWVLFRSSATRKTLDCFRQLSGQLVLCEPEVPEFLSLFLPLKRHECGARADRAEFDGNVHRTPTAARIFTLARL